MVAHPDGRSSSAQATAQELRSFIVRLKRRLREASDAGDLKPSQVAVIQRLEADGPATSSALAQAEGMRPQSMSTIVAALEGAGLVSGTPDPDDGRQRLLALSDACREWLSQGRAARQDWIACAIQERLTVEEQDELARAMRLLQRLVER